MPKPRSLKFNRFQAFLVGLFIGAALFSLPLAHTFSPFEFSHARFGQPSALEGNFPLPTSAPVITHKEYTLAYDGKNRNPLWVYRTLTPAIFEKEASRELSSFKEDPQIPEHIRATNKDYEGSGFDRGHLASALDSSSSQEALDESFLLSNIAPQAPQFNRGYWKKLEGHLRQLVEDHQLVHVFTGPLYLPGKAQGGKRFVRYQVIGDSCVAVPTHFFALIFIETSAHQLLSQAFILPNQAISAEIPLDKFASSVEEVESASGILFSETR